MLGADVQEPQRDATRNKVETCSVVQADSPGAAPPLCMKDFPHEQTKNVQVGSKVWQVQRKQLIGIS